MFAALHKSELFFPPEIMIHRDNAGRRRGVIAEPRFDDRFYFCIFGAQGKVKVADGIAAEIPPAA